MMKKFLSLLLTGALCASMVACGSSNGGSAGNADTSGGEVSVAEESDASNGAAEETGSAGEAADFTTVTEGKLIMATNAYFPPYEYYDGDAIIGIDAEIVEAIAGKLGLEPQIEDMEFDSIIAAVQSGKCDMGLAGMTVTEERLQTINFSDSYATGVQVVIVPEDSDIASLDDLSDGKMIGVQMATTGDIYAKDDFGEDHVEEYNKGADAVLALTSGKIDAVIIDNQPAKSFVASNPGLKILETPYAEEEYAACISKSNEPLLAAVNQALQELKDDGTIQSILDKYISAE
ncbi:MAG: amino acid ABC transporter substrate-binding protein [Lachnospiraceae bacterium]|nr:amino acid ABC transporter substrate-binding protein [Lachnospiraceae bacterium]